jgi:hypothetical protein
MSNGDGQKDNNTDNNTEEQRTVANQTRAGPNTASPTTIEQGDVPDGPEAGGNAVQILLKTLHKEEFKLQLSPDDGLNELKQAAAKHHLAAFDGRFVVKGKIIENQLMGEFATAPNEEIQIFFVAAPQIFNITVKFVGGRSTIISMNSTQNVKDLKHKIELPETTQKTNPDCKQVRHFGFRTKLDKIKIAKQTTGSVHVHLYAMSHDRKDFTTNVFVITWR